MAEDVIGVWLAERPRPVTANEIATGISWTPDSRSIYRITTVLKQLGYTRANRQPAPANGSGAARGGPPTRVLTGRQEPWRARRNSALELENRSPT